MRQSVADTVVPQIRELIERFEELRKGRQHSDWSGIDVEVATEFISGGMAAIYRASGRESPYATQVQEAMEELAKPWIQARIPYVGGTLKALVRDIESGYLITVQELIHAEVFGDFLEMAEYLLEDGYKDPAAMLTGGVLEAHLRKLCGKKDIELEVLDSRGVPRPKKAEAMNSDLARDGVYSKLDQKNVTAWLDLRNKAAHGHYDEYTHQQVQLMLQAVTDFLTRHPA